MKLFVQPYGTSHVKLRGGFMVPLYYKWEMSYHLEYPTRDSRWASHYCIDTLYISPSIHHWKAEYNQDLKQLVERFKFDTRVDKLKQVVKKLYDKRTNKR